jgi:2-haloacid dehalogenase
VAERWATFDCYGTLIDWNRGMGDALCSLWPGADRSALLAAYHRLEPLAQADGRRPYREVLAACTRGVAGDLGLPLDPGDEEALPDSLPAWPPFPEVPAALARLRQEGWRLAVLSNTDPDLLASSLAGIGVPVEATFTVAEAGSYKPAHGHWRAFFATTGADPATHVHVAASLFHDIAPCAELGLRAVWINRAGEVSDLPRAAELTDLAGLPEALAGLS